MNNLTAMIAALKAGKLDDVLAGTKYDDAYQLSNGSPTEGLQHIHWDAEKNAAKVVVLEAALRALHKRITDAKMFLESDWMDVEPSPVALQSHKEMATALAVTASLIEGGK